MAFHRAIADATHNPLFSYLLATLVKMLLEHTRISIAGVLPRSEHARRLTVQHAELLDAILAKDPARARQAARDHLDFVRRRLNAVTHRYGPKAGRRRATPEAVPRSGGSAGSETTSPQGNVPGGHASGRPRD